VIVDHTDYIIENYVGINVYYSQMAYEFVEEEIAYTVIDALGKSFITQN